MTALVAQGIEQGSSKPEVAGSIPAERTNLREAIARSIWAKRPDCVAKPWPLETVEQRRAYPHNPIAAVDLCFIYADAAIAVLNSVAE